jgi:hypothetical protein
VIRSAARLLAVAAVLLPLLAACGGHPAEEGPLRLAWHQEELPMPAGPGGRIAVRDAASCSGAWYVVGAVIGPGTHTRPAAWTSDDGRTWRSLPLDPSSYYARRNILTSVACRTGRVAALGSRSGGAHGNPRVSSWIQRADGTLVDVPAPFVLYGGSQAVSVDRIAAGPDRWVIAGNRTSGAAVWTSFDATEFRLRDDDPQLSSDSGHQTAAVDVTADGHDWTVVGRVAMPGRANPLPLAWRSADGTRWQREEVPAGTRGYADLERVVRVGDGLLAVGIRGNAFGSWRRTADTWWLGDDFGSLDPHGTGARFVSGLAAARAGVLAAVSDGARFGLWARGDGTWREVGVPARPTTSGDHQLTVAADGAAVLLLEDDGTTGRAWLATWD